MTYCHNCGAGVPIAVRYCGECGAALDPINAPQTPWASIDPSRPHAPRAQSPYAGRGSRSGAFLIDFIILFTSVGVVDAILAATFGELSALFLPAADNLLFALYFAAFESSPLQATPGKLALRLQVADFEGRRISFRRAFFRNVAKYALASFFVFSAILRKKRVPHDIAAGTVVVKRGATHGQPTMSAEPMPRDSRRGHVSWMIVAVLFALGVLGFSTFHTTLRDVSIRGAAMQPTLRDHDVVLINMLSYSLGSPRRGDIVDFWAAPAGEPHLAFLQRIVGLPGETVRIDRDRTYINGRRLPEPYTHTEAHYTFGPYTVPSGCYFVLGDNRDDSYDSHVWMGLPKKDIIGKAWLLFGQSGGFRIL